MEETEDFLTDKKIKVIGEIADRLFEESDKEFYKKKPIMNTVCKEHEWVGNKFTALNVGIVSEFVCKQCGRVRSSADFKNEENISEVNKQQWEDIWNEFMGTKEFKNSLSEHLCFVFLTWLMEHYTAPDKK